MIKAIKYFCYWYLNPNKWLHPFFLSFVGMAVMNNSPKYKDYIVGRLEIWSQWSSYDINEYRYLTKKGKEFMEFVDKWEFKNVSWFTLQKVRRYLEKHFHDKVE